MAINVSGLSVQDILKIPAQDINKMNRKDLSTIASRLVSAANKRIRRLEKSADGTMSPSYISYKRNRGGKPFSVKGKDVNALRNEVKQMKNFLNQKTSTVTGWKKVKKATEKRIGGSMTPEQSNKFWDVYHRLEETEGGLIHIIQDSNRIQQLLHQEVIDDPDGDIYNKMMNNLDELYESLFDDINPDWDVDDVFAIDDDF